MAEKIKHRSHGSGSSHFHLPMQFILGLLFLATGILFFLKQIGQNFLPFLPEQIFTYIMAIGSVLGGFYLIVHKIWRPRIYL